jgi:phosphopentomutase
VPLLAFGPQVHPNVNLGTRATLADLGQTVAVNFGTRIRVGTSFLQEIFS